jgi:hypothetical protein
MIGVQIFRRKRTHADFFFFFSIIYFLMYPLTGFLLELNVLDSQNSPLNYKAPWYTSNFGSASSVVIGYALAFLGFNSRSATSLGNSMLVESKSDKTITIIGLIVLTISLLAIALYVPQFGGLLSAVSNTQLIRDQRKGFEGGSMVLFKHFMAFGIFASYLFICLRLIKRTPDYKKLLFLALPTALGCGLLSVLLEGSRGIMITFFLGFYIIYIARTKKLALSLAIPGVLVLMLYIYFGKALTFSLTSLPDGPNAVVEKFRLVLDDQPDEGIEPFKFLWNFAFGFHSLDTALEAEYELRYGTDWIYAFLQLLPERLLGITVPNTVSALNSKLVLGIGAGDADYTIPPALLAYGFYFFSWPGLIFLCYTYGWVGQFIETVTSNHLRTVFWMPMVYFILLKIWVEYGFTGDPRIAIMANFWSWVPLAVLFIFGSRVTFLQKRKLMR